MVHVLHRFVGADDIRYSPSAISETDVVVDGIYITATKQLRKVIAISGGKVEYLSKGGNTKYATHPWERQTTVAPSIETFVSAVDRRVTSTEIDELIKEGVLTTADRA
jgi:hypothetical protein